MIFKPKTRKSAFLLKIAAGLAVVAASAAVMGTASVPAAKAASGINLCIGCPSSPSTSQGSVPICVDSARCATWFMYGGFLVYDRRPCSSARPRSSATSSGQATGRTTTGSATAPTTWASSSPAATTPFADEAARQGSCDALLEVKVEAPPRRGFFLVRDSFLDDRCVLPPSRRSTYDYDGSDAASEVQPARQAGTRSCVSLTRVASTSGCGRGNVEGTGTTACATTRCLHLVRLLHSPRHEGSLRGAGLCVTDPRDTRGQFLPKGESAALSEQSLARASSLSRSLD